MKKALLAFLCLFSIVAKGQFAVMPGTSNFNLPGSTGLDFTQNTATHWNCMGAGYSRIFVSHNCGFTIPNNATILGIEVVVDVIIHDIVDSMAYLTKGSAIVGNDGAFHLPISAASSIKWGADTSLWGTTWTPAEINDTSFGVQFRIREIDNTNPISWADANPVYFFITYSLPSSVAEYTADEVKQYPNPVIDILTLEFPEPITNSVLNIRNALGQMVKSQKTTGNKITADMSNLPAGMYYLQLSGDKRYVTKISKQ